MTRAHCQATLIHGVCFVHASAQQSGSHTWLRLAFSGEHPGKPNYFGDVNQDIGMPLDLAERVAHAINAAQADYDANVAAINGRSPLSIVAGFVSEVA